MPFDPLGMTDDFCYYTFEPAFPPDMIDDFSYYSFQPAHPQDMTDVTVIIPFPQSILLT